MTRVFSIFGFALLLTVFVFHSVSAKTTPEFSKAGFWEVKNSGREVFNFNLGWRFLKGEMEGAQAVGFDDSEWALVNCPHGLEYNSSEASGGSNYQGAAWYRKHFTIEDALQDKVLKLHFESVMGKCKIWLNGVQIGEHFGGYLPFTVSLNKHLKKGDNVIAVWADNSDDPTYPPGKEQTRLDFSYFGGIYRDVWMVATNKVFVTNPNEAAKAAGGGVLTHVDVISDEEARLFTKVDIQNNKLKTAKVDALLRVLSPTGKELLSVTKKVVVRAGKSTQVENSFPIKNPQLWTPWSPDLYRLEVVLKDAQGNHIDGVAIKTGLRKIEFKGKDGFWLNNKPYPGKLIGANRHQDHAYVGNAIPNNGQWRDVHILKTAGCDVVRAAHYPADPAFMDACDALGMFYIEATPGWHFFAEGIFEERVYSDIRNMVRRNRNYASMLMWEPILNETHYPAHFAKRTHDIVHEELPYSGVYTVCDKLAGGQEHFDVLYSNLESVDYANEDRSYFQREWGDNVDDFNAQNSTSRVSRAWGEKAMLVQAKRYAQGDFENFTTMEAIHQQPRQFIGGSLWCGFDHQRGYAVDPFYGGITDVFRQPKYSYEMFRSMREPKQGYEPMIFIAHEMTPFSDPDVTVFTNCEEVRLTVYEGEKVIRRKANPTKYLRVQTPHGQKSKTAAKGRMAMPHPYVVFEGIYEFMDLKSMSRGKKKYNATLVAEGLIDGKVVTSFTRVSGKKPTALKLTLENRGVPLAANGSDFVLVTASMVDEKGNIKRLNESMVRFEVSGEGALIGDESIEANPKRISWGTAPALIRSSNKAGKIKIKAILVHEGKNTPVPGELTFESVASNDEFIQSEMGIEGSKGVTALKEMSESELLQENKRLRRELIQLKLKEEERSQLDQDENR